MQAVACDVANRIGQAQPSEGLSAAVRPQGIDPAEGRAELDALDMVGAIRIEGLRTPDLRFRERWHSRKVGGRLRRQAPGHMLDRLGRSRRSKAYDLKTGVRLNDGLDAACGSVPEHERRHEKYVLKPAGAATQGGRAVREHRDVNGGRGHYLAEDAVIAQIGISRGAEFRRDDGLSDQRRPHGGIDQRAKSAVRLTARRGLRQREARTLERIGRELDLAPRVAAIEAGPVDLRAAQVERAKALEHLL